MPTNKYHDKKLSHEDCNPTPAELYTRQVSVHQSFADGFLFTAQHFGEYVSGHKFCHGLAPGTWGLEILAVHQHEVIVHAVRRMPFAEQLVQHGFFPLNR